jgi:hypothetical protein
LTEQKMEMLLKSLFIAGLSFFIIAGYSQQLKAAGTEITPKLFIKYNYNSNIDAIDEEETGLEPTEHSWVDYLLGIEAKAKQSNTEEGVEGNLGYAQYVGSEGDLEDVGDVRANKYDFFKAQGKGWFTYRGRRFTLEIIDNIVRTRSLEDLYGYETSVISTRYLYTDNTASVQVRFQPSSKTRALVKGSYETLFFDEVENDALKYSEPANSTEIRGYAKFEYDFTPKTTGFVDFQGGQRIFDERRYVTAVDANGIPTAYNEVDTADYNFYQGVLGVSLRFSERTQLKVSGGAHNKVFFDEGQFDMEDYTVPFARINFIQQQANRYRLDLIGEAGTSTYGQDLFFDYYSGSAKFRYYFLKGLYVNVYGTYKQDVFDVEINDREFMWEDDRVDDLIVYGAELDWKIFQKNNNTWLALQLLYRHRTRISNIVDQNDYAPGFPGPYNSYNTEIDYYGAQIQFMPTLLIGKHQ